MSTVAERIAMIEKEFPELAREMNRLRAEAESIKAGLRQWGGESVPSQAHSVPIWMDQMTALYDQWADLCSGMATAQSGFIGRIAQAKQLAQEAVDFSPRSTWSERAALRAKVEQL